MSTEAADDTLGSQARVARPFYGLGNLQPIMAQQVVGATLNFFLYSMHIAVNLDSDFIYFQLFTPSRVAFWHLKSQFEIEWNRFLSVFQSLQNEEKIRCTFIHCDPVLFKLENTKIFFYGFTLKNFISLWKMQLMI